MRRRIIKVKIAPQRHKSMCQTSRTAPSGHRCNFLIQSNAIAYLEGLDTEVCAGANAEAAATTERAARIRRGAMVAVYGCRWGKQRRIAYLMTSSWETHG